MSNKNKPKKWKMKNISTSILKHNAGNDSVVSSVLNKEIAIESITFQIDTTELLLFENQSYNNAKKFLKTISLLGEQFLDIPAKTKTIMIDIKYKDIDENEIDITKEVDIDVFVKAIKYGVALKNKKYDSWHQLSQELSSKNVKVSSLFKKRFERLPISFKSETIAFAIGMSIQNFLVSNQEIIEKNILPSYKIGIIFNPYVEEEEKEIIENIDEKFVHKIDNYLSFQLLKDERNDVIINLIMNELIEDGTRKEDLIPLLKNVLLEIRTKYINDNFPLSGLVVKFIDAELNVHFSNQIHPKDISVNSNTWGKIQENEIQQFNSIINILHFS
ncbi:MAG: hypothetical protein NC236_01595 [Mycoplasma sp.]|nr:hypothetical protein [Mycoplasma sp.]